MFEKSDLNLVDEKDKEELLDALVALVQDGVAVLPEDGNAIIMESTGNIL